MSGEARVLNLIAKFALLPLCLIPRNRSLWVFGNKKGFLDNTRYFMEYAASTGKVRCVWLANDRAEASAVRAQGYESYEKSSLRGLIMAARARVHFICNGYGDVIRVFAVLSKTVNFWHGTPIKKVYLDAQVDHGRFGSSKVSRWAFRSAMRLMNGRIFTLYSTSQLEADTVSAAAGIPKERAVALGSPRMDRIRFGLCSEAVLAHRRGRNVVLFAPTWREFGWGGGFQLEPRDREKLSNVLSSANAVLLVKPHPLTPAEDIKAWGLSGIEGVEFSEDWGANDINDLYPLSSVLVTDVSSAMFDFAALDKPVVLFMPDVNEYIGDGRGVYGYFCELLKQESLVTWADLCSSVEVALSSGQGVRHPSLDAMRAQANGASTCAAIFRDLSARLAA